MGMPIPVSLILISKYEPERSRFEVILIDPPVGVNFIYVKGNNFNVWAKLFFGPVKLRPNPFMPINKAPSIPKSHL